MKKFLLVLGLFSVAAFASCEDVKEQNDDVVQIPPHDGSIIINTTVTHLDSTRDLLIMSREVWVKDHTVLDKLIKDTIPSLGTTKQEGEDSDGNTKSVVVKKDYEFYITVK